MKVPGQVLKLAGEIIEDLSDEQCDSLGKVLSMMGVGSQLEAGPDATSPEQVKQDSALVKFLISLGMKDTDALATTGTALRRIKKWLEGNPPN